MGGFFAFATMTYLGLSLVGSLDKLKGRIGDVVENCILFGVAIFFIGFVAFVFLALMANVSLMRGGPGIALPFIGD